jgi:hypothetical protein
MANVSQKMINAVIPLWNDGLKPCDIALKLSVANQTVYRALHAVGIYPDGTGSRMYADYVTVKPLSLDSIWSAEFRGLFYGEGCAYLARRNWKKGFLYTPTLCLSARHDNVAMLNDIQMHLGGKVQFKEVMPSRGYTYKPQSQWYVVGYAPIRAIIESTDLHHGCIEAKKIQDAQLLYDAILARFEMPLRLGPANLAVIESFHTRLKDIKRYTVLAGE